MTPTQNQTTDLPLPSAWANALLKLLPDGLPGKLLLDVMMARGFGLDESSSVIRRGLDRGVLALGHDLNIIRTESNNDV